MTRLALPPRQHLILITPYTRHGHHRVKVREFDVYDKGIAQMMLLAHILDAEMMAPVYNITTASFTPAAAAIQTAVDVATTSTDYGLLLVAGRIGYGKSAAAAGSGIRTFSSDGTTAGTSTAGTIVQQSGRTVNTTGMSAGVNFTVEPTNKTYLDGFGQLQPFGGDLVYDYPSATQPDAFVSGKTTLGLEHVPPDTSTPTSASLSFSRC